MKKFTFTLGRVMDWRQTQARVEESKLERVYAELRRIDERKAALTAEREESEKAVQTTRGVTGAELAALGAFRRFTTAEQTRLEKLRAECSQRVAQQMQVLATKRRDVRLLERLRETRFKTWQNDCAREIDAQADESFLSKWNASRPLQ